MIIDVGMLAAVTYKYQVTLKQGDFKMNSNNVTFQDGKIVIDQSKALSKMSKYQRYNLEKMLSQNSFNESLNYLKTFVSQHKKVVYGANINKFNRYTQKIESGRFLKLQKNMINSMNSMHKPNNVTKHKDYVGVEIECMIPFFDGNINTCSCSPADECDCTMTASQSRTELSRLFDDVYKIKYASIKDDGSIREISGYFSCEVTVLTRINDLSNLKKVCEVLNNLGAKVNSSCGMHIHLDARYMNETDVKKVGQKFSKSLKVLSKMIPKSRRNNSYCEIGVSRLHGGRYYAVNLTSFRKHKTIEIRAHSSTTDFNKIVYWIKLCDAIKNADKITKECSDINDLTDFIKIDENLLEYITQRTFLFSSDTNIVSSVYQDTDAA